jgi:hypothetical protein
MRYKVAGILMAYVVLGATASGAQSREAGGERVGTIRGQVVDAESLLPLVGVALTVRGLDGAPRPTVLSGSDGRFVVSGVAVGTYSLSGDMLGYAAPRLSDIVVRSGRITFVQLSMQKAAIEMEGLVVTGGYFSRNKAEEATSNASYDGEEVRRAPGSAGDVSRVFMTLPSVAKVSDQSNGLAVRGGSPSENAFFVDNIEIPNINHFPVQGSTSGPISLLSTDLIRNATFYTGGFSSRYGDRMSSVMDIELREGNREELDAQLDLNFAGFGAVAEGPMGEKGSYLASFRRSFLDLLVDAIGTDTDVAPRYSDGTVRMAWDLSDRHRLVTLGILGVDDIAATEAAAVKDDRVVYGDQKTWEGAFGVDWRALWSDGVISNTTVSYMTTGYKQSLWETSSHIELIHQDSQEGALVLRNTNRVQLGEKASLRFGAEAKALVSDYGQTMAEYTGPLGEIIPELVMDDRVTSGRGGLFASLAVDPLPRVTATLGLRSDYFGYTKDWSLSPRAALTLRATQRTNLNLSGGVFRQSLPLVLLAQHEDNRDLREPWAVHVVGGVEHFLSEDTRLTLEGYWKDYRDFPVDPSQPGFFVMDEMVYRYGFFFNHDQLTSEGRARARGVELLVQKKLARGVYGLAAASYSKTEYEAGDGVWRDRVYDNRWTASLEGGYKPNAKWEFSMRWIYAGGPPYTPLDLEASAEAGRDVLDGSRINEARYPAYHSLNVRFDRRFQFQASNLVWYVSVWNAYNRKNIAAYTWNGVKGQMDTSYQWGMLPIFGLEWEF